MKQPSKLSVMRKLAQSNSYILITEDNAILNIKIDLDGDMNDIMQMAQQRSMLERFKEQLGRAIKEYDGKLNKAGNAKRKAKKGTKIPVKQG